MKSWLLVLILILFACQSSNKTQAEMAFAIKDYARAGTLLDLALNESPADLALRKKFAYALFFTATTQKKWHKVIAEWKIVHALDSSAESTSMMAQSYLELALWEVDFGSLNQAYTWCEKGLDWDYNSYDLHRLKLMLLQYQDFAAFKEQCMHMLTFAEWPVEDVLTSAEWLYSKDPQSGFLLLEKATVKFPENDEILWYLVEWEKE